MWDIEYTDEFGDWWDTLTDEEQIDIRASVGLLQNEAPNLKISIFFKILKVQNIVICAN